MDGILGNIYESNLKKISNHSSSYCFQGVRKFLFKSDPSTFPASRRRLLFLYWIDVVFKVLMLILSVSYFLLQVALVIGMLYLYTLVFKRVLAFI